MGRKGERGGERKEGKFVTVDRCPTFVNVLTH